MRRLYIVSFIMSIFLWGCSSENPVSTPETEDNGSILLKLDNQNAPQTVTVVTAILTRSGYQTITANMNIHSDSSATIALNGIAAGQWHLRVDAKNSAGQIEYTGETQVNISAGQITNVFLTLYPVQGSTGGIHITVRWGAAWSNYPGNPVLWINQNPSNPNQVGQAKILYDNGIYKMWYTAGYTNALFSIWYAESPDGKNWTTIGTQPVLKATPGSWDSYTVGLTHVFKENGTYYMYYNGFSGHPFFSTWKVGLATSTDGVNWTKHPQPVLQENSQYNRIGITTMVKHNNIYHAYFAYSNSNYSVYYIGLATSSDKINWTFHNANPVLSPNFAWENNGVTYPTLKYEGGKFGLFYQNKSESAFGYAESADGINFIKDYKPIFTLAQSGWAYLSYPYYVRINNRESIYYTAGYNNDHYGVSLLQR